MSFTTIPIFVNSNYGDNSTTSPDGSTIRFHLNPPIKIPSDKKCVFQLIEANIWWTIANISPELNNNTLQFLVGATTYNITFAKGLYSLDAINDQISSFLVLNSLSPNLIIIQGDQTTSKTFFTLNATNVSINLTNSKIRNMLGFTSGTTLGTGVSGANYVSNDIARLNTITKVLVHSNFTNSTYYNSQNGSTVIASITPMVGVGELITYVPNNVINHTIGERTINEISFWITDQNFRNADTNGESFFISGQILIYDK
jgi:hypothetical protein